MTSLPPNCIEMFVLGTNWKTPKLVKPLRIESKEKLADGRTP